MRTFDLAVKYLQESNFDFKNEIDLYKEDRHSTGMSENAQNKLIKISKDFFVDKTNTFSNEYYRGMTFGAALKHLTMKAYGVVSFWGVAIQIVEAHKDILLSPAFEVYGNSVYPKVMMDAFIKYCDELKPQPTFLNSESELRHEFFMGAFHYVTDKES